jgi:CDP-paratose 2-epimerase
MSALAAEPVALITGGAGFIGSNLAQRLLAEGRRVLVFDNLSRAGVRNNLRMLQERYPQQLEVDVADVRDARAVTEAVSRADEIYHLAAQVAVTTSLESPLEDFEINARGTLNVLEAARRRRPAPKMIFTSTNKVYGALDDVLLEKMAQRYGPVDPMIQANGVSESRPLDFHSPYGCSKGAADQYVLDYARSYGLPAVVFRMSCIYGPHQFGTEDQGWVAHFMIQARQNSPLTIFGDGCQVRDVLYVGDLVEAFVLARQNITALAGRAYNIGGGVRNTLSLLELMELLSSQHELRLSLRFAPWRTGDQRYYVSDTRRFAKATGWHPRVAPSEGIERLLDWLTARTTPVATSRSTASLAARP